MEPTIVKHVRNTQNKENIGQQAVCFEMPMYGINDARCSRLPRDQDATWEDWSRNKNRKDVLSNKIAFIYRNLASNFDRWELGALAAATISLRMAV